MMMKSILAASLIAVLPAIGSAAFYVNENFDGYATGNLIDQGGWTLQNSTTNPIQVVAAPGGGNRVALVNTGQDLYKSFSSTLTPTEGNKVHLSADVNFSAVQGAGDYFMHLNNSTSTTNFYARFFARPATGGGLNLGLLDTSGTGSVTTWGAGVLNLNQTYKVVISWAFVAGADQLAVYVDPTDATESGNTAYLTHSWTSPNAEPTALATVNLRQGGSTTGPTLTLDNLVVTDTFSEVVPEPSVIGLLGLAAFGLISRRRD